MPPLKPADTPPLSNMPTPTRASMLHSRLTAEVAGLTHRREPLPRTPGRRSSDRKPAQSTDRRSPDRSIVGRNGTRSTDRDSATLTTAAIVGRCLCGGTPLAVRLRMRSAQRPQFEGTWHCGSKCLDTSVRAAVRREFRAGEIFASRVHHRIPLGLILQTRGVLTADELRRALFLQEQTGAKLGNVLVEHFRVDERRIAAALAAQWNAPLWHLPSFASEELLRLAPLVLFRGSGTLPLRLIGTKLSLASADGIDAPIALALERMHGVTVESGIALTSAVDTIWNGIAAIPQRKAEEVACEDADDIARRMTRTILQTQPVESRSVRVGRRMWLRLWLESAALSGGPCQSTDIVDYLFRLPSATTHA